MNQQQAYSLIPADAVWSSSFGSPGHPGFAEYWRSPSALYIINRSRDECAPEAWSIKVSPLPIALDQKSAAFRLGYRDARLQECNRLKVLPKERQDYREGHAAGRASLQPVREISE